MEKGIEIANMIKRFIKHRNKTIRMTSQELGIEYTTFCEQLRRGSLRAECLFRLAVYLDIDLNWMMAALNYFGQSSEYEREIIPRMQPSFRKKEQELVLPVLDDLIRQNLGKTKEIRDDMLKIYDRTLFYLLDVLVPEEYSIRFYNNNRSNREDNVVFLVDTFEQNKPIQTTMMNRKPVRMLLSASEALDIIIEERKEIIL